jgi:hypothetical protein
MIFSSIRDSSVCLYSYTPASCVTRDLFCHLVYFWGSLTHSLTHKRSFFHWFAAEAIRAVLDSRIPLPPAVGDNLQSIRQFLDQIPAVFNQVLQFMCFHDLAFCQGSWILWFTVSWSLNLILHMYALFNLNRSITEKIRMIMDSFLEELSLLNIRWARIELWVTATLLWNQASRMTLLHPYPFAYRHWVHVVCLFCASKCFLCILFCKQVAEGVSEFTPTPEQNRDTISTLYAIPNNLLVRKKSFAELFAARWVFFPGMLFWWMA